MTIPSQRSVLDRPPELDEPYMTIKEVQTLLRVSYWTVYRLINNREITGVRIGRAHRIVASSVAAYRARLLEEVA